MRRSEPDNTSAGAASELVRLQGELATTRALVTRLQQEVALSRTRLAGGGEVNMLAVNEQLVVHAVGAQVEAEQSRQALGQAWHASRFDALTDLPNRLLLLDRLAVAIANATRHRTQLALLFLDLNNFKQINDTFGHPVGDQVLRRAATSLASSVRAGDTVSRHGGDEFLVLLAEITHATDAVHVADKMIANLGAPQYVNDQLIRLTVSIGISIFPDDGTDAAELIECADRAMFRAKKHGIGSFVFHGQDSMSGRTVQLPALVFPGQQDNEGALGEHERRNAQLREANQRLLLAVLRAQAAPQSPAAKSSSAATTEVGPIVDAAIEECRPALDLRLQNLTVQRTEERLAVHCDPVSLTRIVGNLLGNASKYTPDGGNIGIALRASGETLTIAISDSGLGIAAEVLPGIFAAGDGLRSVKELAEAQGGKVTASSDGRECGSRFTVTLPLA
ncbi:MAG: diguanylate cyclase [Pseudomonadota bacterium]